MHIKSIIKGNKHQTAVADLVLLRDFFEQRDNCQYNNIELAGQIIENGMTVLMAAAAVGRHKLIQLLIGQDADDLQAAAQDPNAFILQAALFANNIQDSLENLLTTTDNSGFTVYNYATNHLTTMNYIGGIMQQVELAIPGMPGMIDEMGF